jgi:hypothetical protein
LIRLLDDGHLLGFSGCDLPAMAQEADLPGPLDCPGVVDREMQIEESGERAGPPTMVALRWALFDRAPGRRTLDTVHIDHRYLLSENAMAGIAIPDELARAMSYKGADLSDPNADFDKNGISNRDEHGVVRVDVTLSSDLLENPSLFIQVRASQE